MNPNVARSNDPLQGTSLIEDSPPPPPKWHDCKIYPNAPSAGKILVSFEICEVEKNFPIEAKIFNIGKYITFRRVTFEIHVLGLRDLKSAGILPVKKASITFNFKNLI
jgi:hypothetical protein